jgi:hypothetical protein
VSSVITSDESSVVIDDSVTSFINSSFITSVEVSSTRDFSLLSSVSSSELVGVSRSTARDFSVISNSVSDIDLTTDTTRSITVGGRVTSTASTRLPELILTVSENGRVIDVGTSLKTSIEDSFRKEESINSLFESTSFETSDVSDSQTVAENEGIVSIIESVENSEQRSVSVDFAEKSTIESVSLESDEFSETSELSVIAVSDSTTDISVSTISASTSVVLSDVITNVNTSPVSSVSLSETTDSVSEINSVSSVFSSFERSSVNNISEQIFASSDVFTSEENAVVSDVSSTENISTLLLESVDNGRSIDVSGKISISTKEFVTRDTTRVSEGSVISFIDTSVNTVIDVTESVTFASATDSAFNSLLSESFSKSTDSGQIIDSTTSITDSVLSVVCNGERFISSFDSFVSFSESKSSDVSGLSSIVSSVGTSFESTSSFDSSVRTAFVFDSVLGLSESSSFTQSNIISSDGSVLLSDEQTVVEENGVLLNSAIESIDSQSLSQSIDRVLQVQSVSFINNVVDDTQTIDGSDKSQTEIVLRNGVSEGISRTETEFIGGDVTVSDADDVTSVLESDRQEFVSSFIDSSNEVTIVDDVSNVSIAESQTDLSVDSTRSFEKVSQRSDVTSVTPVISDAELLTVSFDAVKSSTGLFNSFNSVSNSSSIDTSVISSSSSDIDISVSSSIVFDDVSNQSVESIKLDSSDFGIARDSVNTVESLSESELSISESTSVSIDNQNYDVSNDITKSSDKTESIDESNESFVIALSGDSFSRSSSITDADEYESVGNVFGSVSRSIATDISTFISSVSKSFKGVSESVSLDEAIESDSLASVFRTSDSTRSVDEPIRSGVLIEEFVSDETSLSVDASVLSTSVSPVEISLETAVAFVNATDNALITSVVFEPARSSAIARVFIDGVLVGTASPFSDIDTITSARDESVDTVVESIEFKSDEFTSALDISGKSLSTPFSERIDVLTEAVAEGTVFVVGSNVVVLTDDDIFFVVTSTSGGESNVEVLQATDTSLLVENSQNDVRVLNE